MSDDKMKPMRDHREQFLAKIGELGLTEEQTQQIAELTEAHVTLTEREWREIQEVGLQGAQMVHGYDDEAFQAYAMYVYEEAMAHEKAKEMGLKKTDLTFENFIVCLALGMEMGLYLGKKDS